MYLSDREIRARLEELCISTRFDQHVFDPETQIQPCSIDLRLDCIFWRQKKRRTAISLRSSVVDVLDARRYWHRIVLTESESITLKPGEMILGRIYEKFTLPPDLAARIAGRSSFARMGLTVSCSGDFINPGYHGHMPLQLVNNSSSSIKVSSFLPLCQLIFVPLTSVAERPYGTVEVGSKYEDDDGGPSYWWRDRSFTGFKAWLEKQNMPEGIRTTIANRIGRRETAVLERFEAFFDKLKVGEVENTVEVLAKFAEKETFKSRIAQCWRWFTLWIGPALVMASLSRLMAETHSWKDQTLWTATILAVLFSIYCWCCQDPPGDYFTAQEFEKQGSDG